MKYLLFLCVLLAAVFNSSAQKRINGMVTGKLTDSVAHETLAEATVSLLDPADSAVITYVLANAKGQFTVKDLTARSYLLTITYAGYADISKSITLTEAMPVLDLGAIYMEKKSAMLDEVIVQVAPITVNKDTVEFRAGAFKTIPNATAEDLLKKLPGVEVDKDGNVKAQGEDIRKIYVDGKEFFGNDPKLATKNITADMIESVQVYDDMSDQAKFTRIDDGSRSKTINIKLKKNRRKGYFGRATVGAGTDNRYMANVNANKFDNDRRISLITNSNNLNRQQFSGGGNNSGGGNGNTGGITRATSAGLNYTDKISPKIDLQGSYFYNESRNNTSQSSLRQSFFPNDSVTFQESMNNVESKNQNHRFNLKMEYYIDSMNSILYTPTLSVQRTVRSSFDSLSTRTTQPGIDYLALSGTNRNTNDRQGINLNNNLLYRRKFRKTGRTFTFGLTNSVNNSDATGTSLYPLTFYNPDNTIDHVRNQNFKSSQQTRSGNNVVSTSFTEPLGKNKILELNYAYTRNKSTSDRDAYNYNPFTKQFDSLNLPQTNYFENDFMAHRMGFNFRVQKVKYGFQAGGAMQSSVLENESIRAMFRVNGKDSVIHYEQHANNFFPTANFNYNFRRGKTFRINYRGRTNQPGVTQLQDVRDETNSLRTQQGNPGLKQEFSNDLNATYNTFNPVTFRYFNANLNYNQVSNKIVNSIALDTARGKGIQLIRPVNLNGAFNASSQVTLGIPLRGSLKGSSLNFSNSINYNRDISLLYNQQNTTTSVSIRQKAGVNIDIQQKINFGIDASVAYNTVNYSNGINSNQQSKLSQNQDNTYFLQTYSADVNYFFTKTFFVSTSFDYLLNTGRAAGFNQSVPLWNASLSKQMFAKKNGELKLSVNDILNQNRNITRTVTENYIIDSRTVVLRRYFLLAFTYNLNRTGGRRQQGQDNRMENRRVQGDFNGDGPSGGGAGGGRRAGGRP